MISNKTDFAVGVCGFLDFGSSVDGVILENYSDRDTLVNVGRFIMAVHVALAYPVIFHPAQSGLIRWAWTLSSEQSDSTSPFMEPLVSTLSESPGGEEQEERGEWSLHTKVPPLYVRVGTALVVGGLTAAAAICVPEVEIVFG